MNKWPVNEHTLMFKLTKHTLIHSHTHNTHKMLQWNVQTTILEDFIQ